MQGPLPPGMMRPRSPYPPAHLIQSGRIRPGSGHQGPGSGPPTGARYVCTINAENLSSTSSYIK